MALLTGAACIYIHLHELHLLPYILSPMTSSAEAKRFLFESRLGYLAITVSILSGSINKLAFIHGTTVHCLIRIFSTYRERRIILDALIISSMVTLFYCTIFVNCKVSNIVKSPTKGRGA